MQIIVRNTNISVISFNQIVFHHISTIFTIDIKVEERKNL